MTTVNFGECRAWQVQLPVPHVKIDNFLPQDLALNLYRESGQIPDQYWRDFTRNGSYMRECNDLNQTPYAQQLVGVMHSGLVLDRLEQISGIKGLIPDPYLTGAGYSQSGHGHVLKRHTDFNWNERLKLHRAVSVIVYLNPNWQPQWGGALDFYDHLGQQVEISVDCEFNSCVIWKYDQLGYHGYEQPLACPKDQYRTTFRFFYYTSNSKYRPHDMPHRSLYWKDPETGLPVDAEDYEFVLNPDDQYGTTVKT